MSNGGHQQGAGGNNMLNGSGKGGGNTGTMLNPSNMNGAGGGAGGPSSGSMGTSGAEAGEAYRMALRRSGEKVMMELERNRSATVGRKFSDVFSPNITQNKLFLAQFLTS